MGGLGHVGKRRRLAGCDFFSTADFVSAVNIFRSARSSPRLPLHHVMHAIRQLKDRETLPVIRRSVLPPAALGAAIARNPASLWRAKRWGYKQKVSARPCCSTARMR